MRVRCDADEFRDLLPREPPQLGQLADERQCGDAADAGGAPEQVLVLAPRGALAHAALEFGVRHAQLALQVGDVLREALAHRARVAPRGPAEPVALGLEHLEELASARGQRVERVQRLVGERAHLGPDALREQGEHARVDPVRLGELAGRAGEVVHAAGVPCRGLATTTGSPAATRAATSAATRASSYPPVASSTTSAGARAVSREATSRTPAASLGAVHGAGAGRASSTSSSFATSIPTETPAAVSGVCGMYPPGGRWVRRRAPACGCERA
jgi:hypothetical protein